MTSPQYVPLDEKKHRHLTLNTAPRLQALTQKDTAFIVLEEVVPLANEYPLFITKNPTTGQFQLVALLGLDKRQNLFIENGQWQAFFLPMECTTYPFRLYLPEADSSDRGLITLDPNHPSFSNEGGTALFTPSGEPSPMLTRIQQCFASLMQGTEATQRFLTEVQHHQLLEPVTIEYENPAGDKVSLTGFYQIDEAALAGLDPEPLKSLHDSGALRTCYALLNARTHIEKLAHWLTRTHRQ
ncbi:SapC family protein [Marinimicrobium sp. C2-29]|uniref:SapC family protein n=1 Tax=Marinimicrobium sp. C2-29 TaxID=3139825 RepID=UPI003139C391